MRSWMVLVTIALLGTRAAAAQGVKWSGTVEASGNVLFGAARGRLGALAVGASRADTAVEVRTDLLATYADARNDEGETDVTARASRASLAVDLRPYARVSHFAFGAIESSLQQRIARRYTGGAGTKLTFWRRNEDDVSASLALLWERTRALDPLPPDPQSTTRVRWSLRVRTRRQLTTALHFSHVTFYQPAVDALARYTTDSNTSLALALNSRLNLTTTLRHKYDSEAGARGARSNHDGQLLFGLSATF